MPNPTRQRGGSIEQICFELNGTRLPIALVILPDSGDG